MKFYTICLIVLSMALGYSLAPKSVEASGTGSVSDSLNRMANGVEHIELLLKKSVEAK